MEQNFGNFGKSQKFETFKHEVKPYHVNNPSNPNFQTIDRLCKAFKTKRFSFLLINISSFPLKEAPR